MAIAEGVIVVEYERQKMRREAAEEQAAYSQQNPKKRGVFHRLALGLAGVRG